MMSFREIQVFIHGTIARALRLHEIHVHFLHPAMQPVSESERAFRRGLPLNTCTGFEHPAIIQCQYLCVNPHIQRHLIT